MLRLVEWYKVVTHKSYTFILDDTHTRTHTHTHTHTHQSHELDRLNQLRQAYLTRMTNKVRSKSTDSDSLTISPDRRELHFLEKNLEELSRAHKKVQQICVYARYMYMYIHGCIKTLFV